ncbi:uncharacterized protein LOC123263664 [Cotesia glomerata]|uniref:Uncharacterized protein n=1 Tax=Cotesia glomerata TaxID=32391 RepID=A0AAV7IM69_COTGL|nr:uncharacterized protein LOC123263664 [Cotesia glomerata]KAH0554683.1 hypothetical protein KQX54_012265 [Cotesia glomerata]
MCKLFLISLILTSSLSLSFSINNSNLEENEDLYELNLIGNESDVVTFVKDGWTKLPTRGIPTEGVLVKSGYVKCAKVKIADTERRYTIVARYSTIKPNQVFHCTISVMTTQTEPLDINCLVGTFAASVDPPDYEDGNDAFSAVFTC